MSVVERALRRLKFDTSTDKPTPSVGQLTDRNYRPTLHSGERPRSSKLIQINREGLRAIGLAPSEDQNRQLANEYRRIKRPLIAAATGMERNLTPSPALVMIASALPGEGKSFTSMNLALSTSLESDVSALLVDADVANPFISRAFGVDTEPGLMDSIMHPELDVNSLIIDTDMPGLSILPAGTHFDTASEMLASVRARELMKSLLLADERRIVFFDSPPLLLTNESRVLGGIVGQIVLVVRAGVTERTAVSQALALLPQDKRVRAVLNQSVGDAADSDYGYGSYPTTSRRVKT